MEWNKKKDTSAAAASISIRRHISILSTPTTSACIKNQFIYYNIWMEIVCFLFLSPIVFIKNFTEFVCKQNFNL